MKRRVQPALLATALVTLACGTGAGEGRGDGGDPFGVVAVRNLTPRLVREYECTRAFATSVGAQPGACAEYELSFVLENLGAHAITRLDSLEVRLSTGTIRPGLATCQGPPWTVPAGGTSGIIHVRVDYAFDELTAPCLGPEGEVHEPLGFPPEASAEGTLALRATGALADGSPWIAEGESLLMTLP